MSSGDPLSGILQIALASVDYGGPRPAVLTPRLLRALLTAGALGDDDEQLVRQLLEPKRRLIERMRTRTTEPLHTFACANCDGPAADAPWIYCSELCKQMAGTIRYGRHVHADGRIDDPDVAEALHIRLAMVTGGGYPAQARQLSDAQRAAVIVGDKGACRRCGQPADQVDHISGPIDGDINHPDNLQLLCDACHRAKTVATFVPATHPVHVERAREMRRRIGAPEPERRCDDPLAWPQLQDALRTERRGEFERLLGQLVAAL